MQAHYYYLLVLPIVEQGSLDYTYSMYKNNSMVVHYYFVA